MHVRQCSSFSIHKSNLRIHVQSPEHVDVSIDMRLCVSTDSFASGNSSDVSSKEYRGTPLIIILLSRLLFRYSPK